MSRTPVGRPLWGGREVTEAVRADPGGGTDLRACAGPGRGNPLRGDPRAPPRRRAGGRMSSAGMDPAERFRAISTARLSALPHVHLRPIDVIVFDGPVYKEILS